jgi:Family of unknown function (DUF5343)
MQSELETICPYAPYGNVLTVIRHMRDRGLKEPVTQQVIGTIGVAEGNTSRTLQALRFLNLLDEEGYYTQNFKVLRNAPSGDYPGVLAQTLRDAYQHVFMALDPATATEDQFEDAFRYYQPQAQRQRMIMLFKGLCREAELMPGGAPEAVKRSRTLSSKKSLNSSNGAKKAQPKSEPSSPTDGYQVSTTLASLSVPTESTQEHLILDGLLKQLPFAKGKWTQPRREKWLQAMTATVDLLFEIVDSEIEEDIYRE